MVFNSDNMQKVPTIVIDQQKAQQRNYKEVVQGSLMTPTMAAAQFQSARPDEANRLLTVSPTNQSVNYFFNHSRTKQSYNERKQIQNRSNGQNLKGLVFEDATNREVEACMKLFGDVK